MSIQQSRMIRVYIVFKIDDKEIKLDLNEAEGVYHQLDKLFGIERPIINPNPVYPYQPIYSNANKE